MRVIEIVLELNLAARKEELSLGQKPPLVLKTL